MTVLLARSAEAASSGIAAEAVGEGGDKDKDKTSGSLVGKKRARLLPERSFEKVTPEAGEDKDDDTFFFVKMTTLFAFIAPLLEYHYR